MNILYCGDRKIEDGLIISLLSLLKHIPVTEPLHIYVMTVTLKIGDISYRPVTDRCIGYLNQAVAERNGGGFVRKIDATDLFLKDMPVKNMDTRFTPCCMLRLFADEIAGIPDRVLYLDNDVVCRKDIRAFYGQNMGEAEIAGILDHYGKWFFRKHPFRMDYVNSGVLLLNMKRIRESGLFERCRNLCKHKKMFMPDQSALNKLAKKKIITERKYNEQRKLHKDTVLQHFTTSFRFFPWLHMLTVKPWQTEQMHKRLGLYEYDDILARYQKIRLEI